MKQSIHPNQMLLDGATQQEKVVQNAIDRVRLAYEVSKGAKLYVCFSGGKDSTVLYDIVKRAAEKDGVRVSDYCDLVYNITGVDPPELVYFMRRTYPELQWSMYSKSMWRLIEINGPPTRLHRFCCAGLKERGGEGRMCCTGVRWAESVRRATTRGAFEDFHSDRKQTTLFNDNDQARRFFEQCLPKQKFVCNPIVDFTDENIWAYIHNRKLPYCHLYDEGFDRLGCIGCPMSKRAKAFIRWPKFQKLYVRAFDKYLARRASENQAKVMWRSGQEVFDWWMNDRNIDKPIPGQKYFDKWSE